MQSLIGTGVALVTPFRKDFSVDVEALKAIVNFQVDNGIDYLVLELLLKPLLYLKTKRNW